MKKFLFLTTTALACGAITTPAFAAGNAPVHVTRDISFVADAPAGTVCDFGLEARVDGTMRQVRYYDTSGNLTRIEAQYDVAVDHINTDTGKTLSEEDHYNADVDFASGVIRQSGQTWHLRDENGRLVLVGAGLAHVDLLTGELIDETPNDTWTTDPCALLGDAS